MPEAVTARVVFPGESLAFGPPDQVVRAETLDEVRGAVDRADQHARAGGYAVGYVSYQAAPAFDPALTAHPGGTLPLVWFGLYAAPLPPRTVDEPEGDGWLCSTWSADTDTDSYRSRVDAVRAAIRRGDTYQANVTMELSAQFAGDPVALWHRLLDGAGEVYAAYLDLGGEVIMSFSPELFVDRDGDAITTRPMKGTRPRGPTPAEDDALAAVLVGSAKDRAENLMIVDLMRNDLSRTCRPGSVVVSDLFALTGYPTVWQLTSTVSGTAAPGTTLADLFTALFPCGSVTGAPKPSTMSIIGALERRPRGVYCGAVGLVRPGGAATFNVAIRTLTLDRASGRAAYGAGGGVVWDSTADGEYAEAVAKTRLLELTQHPVTLLETMAFDGREVRLLDRHLDRLAGSADRLGRSWDRAAAYALVAAVTGPPQRLRLLLAGDGTLALESRPLDQDPQAEPWPVALATTPVRADDPWLRLKTTDRRRYTAHTAARPDVRDVLLWNERGELTEFTIGNLVVDLDGQRCTPPVSSGLLAGVLRAELLDTGVVTERVLTRADLVRADGVWLVNAVRGWVPVRLTGPG